VSKPTYEELVKALQQARDDLADWGAYAPEYFQEKWGLEDDLNALDVIIADARG